MATLLGTLRSPIPRVRPLTVPSIPSPPPISSTPSIPNRPLRVLHAVESWRPRLSGYTIRSHELLTAQLRADDLDPHIVVSSRQESYGVHEVEQTPSLGVAAVPPSGREQVLRRVRRFYVDAAHQQRALEAACQQIRPDLLHSHWSSGLGMAAARAAHAAEVPFIAEVRFDLAGAVITETVRRPFPLLERTLRRRFERHLARADAVIAASYSLGDLLRREVPGLPEIVRVVPNGVDVETFQAGPPDAALREKLGLTGKIVVGSTSNMQRYEGLDVLLRAAARAHADVPNLHVFFVGSGVQHDELKALAAKLRVPVTFTGRVPSAEVPCYLRQIDLFAVPRHDATITRYASPLKLVEALAAGRAIIGSRVGDIPQLLGDGRGHLIAPGSEEELAAALVALGTDDAEREALGRQARAWAEVSVTWNDTARLTQEVYRDVLAARGVR